jgi:uncharacterized protein
MVSGVEKLFYLTLGIIFLVIGVVGLIVPILPGVLFLAGSLYMLGRGSSRVKQLADENPTLRRFQTRMEQVGAATMVEQLQVTFLTIIQVIAVGVRKISIGVKKLLS